MKLNKVLIIVTSLLVFSSCGYSSLIVGTNSSFFNSSSISSDSEVSSLNTMVNTTISSSTTSQSSSLSDSQIVETTSLTINSSNYSIKGNYSSGNYGETTCDGYKFEYYRAITGDFITLLPYLNNKNDQSKHGAIYNISPFSQITKIDIIYKTEYGTGENPKFSCGLDYRKSNISILDNSLEYKTFTFNEENFRFFKVETGDCRLYIKEIKLTINQIEESYNLAYLSSGEGDYRLNPVTYNDDLEDGVTSVEVPLQIEINNEQYTTIETKTYTYYSYDYIENNSSLADEAALVDPIDIANYYALFKEFPANFVKKSKYDDAFNLFGTDTRCVSTYHRTDGYAKSVPWIPSSGYSTPTYHEFDLKLTSSYSKNNRGVGRLVIWENGFNCEGYDSSPIAVYTDDHYATFSEYLYTGNFGKRFNAEMNYTFYRHSPSKTLN